MAGKETLEFLLGAKKAILAGAMAAVSAAALAASDGSIDSGEWWRVAAAGVLAVGGVYGVKNTGPKAPQA